MGDLAQMDNKRKKRADPIESDEQRLQHLAANTLFGLALVDNGLRLMNFNRKFDSFFPAAERGGLLCDGLDRHCARPDSCAACPVRLCLKQGGNHECDFASRAAGSPERFFRLASFPVQLAPPGSARPAGRENGNKLALALLEDVTQKRALEQKLTQSRRLEAMSTLAAGIAHEINQPLSALNLYAGSLQMLLEKDELPPPKVIRERIGLILGQAKKISEITQHMWAMAARAASALEEVDALAVLLTTLRDLQPKLQAGGIKVIMRRPQRVPTVKAVGVQLAQVFTNLITNAVQALTSEEGRRSGGERLIRFSLSHEPGLLLVEVADTGPGVPPGLERRIFDPFFSTKGPNGGLGLSIVHAFLRSWEGDIQVAPRHPELGGAAFSITLKTYGSGE
jgi:signal transduction histidine kinase